MFLIEKTLFIPVVGLPFGSFLANLNSTFKSPLKAAKISGVLERNYLLAH